MLKEDQLPERYRKILEEQVKEYDAGTSITIRNSIPDTGEIPLTNTGHWLKIPDVISVFVDMKDSTKLSANTQDKNTAGIYQLFTGTAVKLFHEFQAPYIDVRGDGVFALFDKDTPFTAIAAAISFKTFSKIVFEERIKKKTNELVGAHIGIDQKTVLVRRLGLKRHDGRTDRQNEVWAGKPVNMSAKLASIGAINQLIVSDRFFSSIQNDLVLKSCGCPNDECVDLWTKVDLSLDPRFDFDTCYRLTTNWCGKHGKDFCERILALDKK